MSQQRHIINKQILEIHLPEDVDVNAVQEEISKLYQEKIVPIINDLCDRHSAAGTLCKIDSLTIDLGTLQLEGFEEAFAEKFAEAIASEEVEMLPDNTKNSGGTNGTDDILEQKAPLDVLAHYLMTGTMPWWAASSTKKYLHELLDGLNDAPNATFIALLKEISRKKEFLDRFIFTFSEAQIQQSFSVLSALPMNDFLKIREEISAVILHKPLQFVHGLTAKKVTQTFWSAVFAHVAIANDHSSLMRFAIQQTLQTMGVDPSDVLKEIQQNPSSQGIIKWIDVNVNPSLKDQTEIHRQVKEISLQHQDNPLIQASCKQLLQRLSHPLFSHLDPHRIQALARLIQDLKVAQSKAEEMDTILLKVVTETNLAPLAKHIHHLDFELRQMDSSAASNVMESLHSSHDETDFITVENAGLVILWPFLQRFFNNLDLLDERAFKNEEAQHKAACLLQYLADEEEEEVFEGQLVLNKVLCGIALSDPLALEPLSEEDKEMAEGLLRSVVSRGPLWKNLSLSGLRTNYMQREASLRSRDGHWLLQVKKETHDITLEKLPWSFNTVKLPWMNEILIIEWI